MSMYNELRRRLQTGEYILGMTPCILRAIRREIEQWLRRQPRVKIAAEVIFVYVFSFTLPEMFSDDGVRLDFRFHPPKATSLALIWAEVRLDHNPHAEINNAEEWAGAVAGGNQILLRRRAMMTKRPRVR